jgi:hypothetical protein
MDENLLIWMNLKFHPKLWMKYDNNKKIIKKNVGKFRFVLNLCPRLGNLEINAKQKERSELETPPPPDCSYLGPPPNFTNFPTC